MLIGVICEIHKDETMIDDIISMDDTVAKEKKDILFQDDLSGTYTKEINNKNHSSNS